MAVLREDLWRYSGLGRFRRVGEGCALRGARRSIPGAGVDVLAARQDFFPPRGDHQKGLRGGCAAPRGLSRGISTFFGSEGGTKDEAEDHTVAEGRAVAERAMGPEDATVPPD